MLQQVVMHTRTTMVMRMRLNGTTSFLMLHIYCLMTLQSHLDQILSNNCTSLVSLVSILRRCGQVSSPLRTHSCSTISSLQDNMEKDGNKEALEPLLRTMSVRNWNTNEPN